MRSLLLCCLLVACGAPAGPSARLAQLSIIAGDAQTDTVAHQLPLVVVARAATPEGQIVPQMVVNWYRIAGADTVFAGAGLTDARGEARLAWILLTKAGPQELVGWVLDENGVRQAYAQAIADAMHDRATVVLGGPRIDTLTVAVGAPIFDHDSYSAAYDQFRNWAGPMHWKLAAGWRVSADTAWCDTPGLYTMQLVLDDVTSHLTVRVR